MTNNAMKRIDVILINFRLIMFNEEERECEVSVVKGDGLDV